MSYPFDPSRPIYTQLLELIITAIAAGEYAPGAKLPGVRELALEFGVNPNTAQRTMSELERQGLVHTERTTGRFVTTDEELIRKTRIELARGRVQAFLTDMEKLGLTAQEISALLIRQENR